MRTRIPSRRPRRSAVLAAVLLVASLGLPWPAAVGAHDPVQKPVASGQPEVLRVRTAVTAASTPVTGFTDNTVMTGLVNPTVVQFASDGRVFVAEKSGIIKVYPSLTSTTPTVFADLRTNVHNYWDRGLLGMALDPAFPARPYVYVLYAYDHILGSAAPAPRWGTAGATGDDCPTPPGSTTDGCVISARLSKLTASGDVAVGGETVLIEDWCQQFPSHSIGSIVFGSDGALYASGGDGANFNNADWGQWGNTYAGDLANPCGDPPSPAGTALAPPNAEGGALRAQDVRTIPAPAGSTYAATIAADGPTAWWRLGETSGTTAADSSATGSHPGTYTGTVSLGQAGAIAGDTNTAIAVAGAGYVQTADAADLHFGDGPMTWELWTKRGTVQGAEQILVSEGGLGTPVVGFTADNQFGFGKGGIGYLAVETGTTTDQNWHHFVVTHDTSATHIYKDGVDVTGPVTSMTLAQPTDGVQIGREAVFADSPVTGTIDEVALYSKILSPATIANHNQVGRTAGGTSSDPTGMNGSIIRIDPDTGAGLPTNPLASSTDPAARRIIASGLRNPFRITTRPGTSEIWVGDVGWNDWEEIDRIASPTAGLMNFGWPCYEGGVRQVSYESAGLTICQNLYATPSAATGPYYTYKHTANIVSGETCPIGSSAIAGMAFYPDSGGTYPTAYRGALFFADHSRNCIWAMLKGSNGNPDPAQIQVFVAAAAGPVDLVIGPGGDLFYVDFDGGTLHRITFASGNQAPTASFTATPSSGPAPLSVHFDASASSDPEGDALTYAWDLDGDGQYNDATGVTADWTYQSPGTVNAGLQVTDSHGASGTTTRLIDVGNSPPVPTIDTPAASLTWKVGDVIAFSGHANDAQDGVEPASRLSWALILHHCPSNCHTHTISTIDGVASGSFTAPDHEYPSYLELVLTATDANGASASTSINLQPQTVDLTFQTVPTGLTLAVNTFTGTTPFSRTVIVGSANSISAAATQTLNGLTYTFVGWSDGGAASHTVIAGSTPATYTATYQTTSSDLRVTQTASTAPGTLTVTFSGSVSTAGPASALGVVLTDTLTKRLAFISASSTAGTCAYASATQTVTCSIGTVTVGQTVVVTIVATVSSAKGPVSNTMTVTTTSPDPVSTNNSSSVSLKIR